MMASGPRTERISSMMTRSLACTSVVCPIVANQQNLWIQHSTKGCNNSLAI